ncbi:MAG: InlB B-repeat-containing protein [Lachnospiraceae bacterium]|nr:InlB B-repeat-containing protein [Lachnospiraceae bacterium]
MIKALGHNWGDWNTKIQAKCKEAGSKERTCSRCDKVETQIIPAEGHNTLGTPRIVQPTCITDGYTTAVCSKCYCESGTKTILPATGKHHWEDWVEDQKPTCVEKGKKHRICNVCHKAEFGEINELGHNVQGYRNISATCEEDGYSGVVCSRCGQVMDGAKVYPATGHDWGNWIVDVEPKGDTIGARHRICKKCQKREDDNLWGGIDSYVIHFDGNGNLDGQMEDMKLKYGAWFIVPECDFDYGNGFDCWCTTKDGTGQCYKVGFSDQERGLVTDRSITNITLYAIWNECAVTYHDGISKAPLGKSVMEGHVFLPKGTYKYPSLKIDGLVLKGWSSEPGELIGGKVDYMMGAKNVNKLYTDLYPVYRFSEDNKWAVIYDPNGGTGGPGVKVYDKGKEDITVVGGEPSLTGYTFDGWEYPYKPIDRLYKDSWILPDWFENGNVRLIAKWKYNNRQLILDYGYDGKTDEITIDYDSYKLPDPDDRDGYIFRGWGLNKDTPVYSGGQAYNPDEGTTKLYAVWEPIKFIVEYYDCYTKKLLLREETDCSKNIRGNLCTIKGLNFDGWEETVYRRLPNGSSYNTVKTHKAGAPAVGLDFRSGVVKLYSKYSFIEHDGIWVIYHPNGGDTSPNYSAFSDTQAVKINDGSGMTKAGCKFVGWNSDKAFLSVNGSITTRTKNIMLIAEWKSTITFTLNYAEAPFPEFTAPNWVIPGQVIAVSDFGEPNWPGHYLQGWKDQKGTFYPIYSYYTIPSQNTVMTAVWGDYIYKIYYHNGFSGDLYDVPQDVGIEGTIDYTPPKEVGYKFEGWLTSLPSESPVGREPKYHNGEDRTFSKDLHLYSCFSEECTTSANTITVIYNNKGGEGGPGVVTYTRNANPSFEVSDLEPERKGYKFLGWSKSYYAMSVDFYPKDPCGGYDIPQDGPLTLYAVWGFDHTSDLKAEMQRRFGNVVMPDSYFDYETKLNTWHKVNDYCYFVLKTENEIDSNHVKYMTSTVMIIEFKNGKWSLESIGINQRVPEILSYYVTTHTNDLTGLLVTLGIDALEGIVALISPTAGIIMDVCTANEMIGELYRNYNIIPDFIEELTVSLCTEIVDVIRGNLLDSGVSIEDAEALIVSQYDWIRKECECSATDLANQIIELGGTGLDIVGFSTYLEPLWEKIGIKMSESVKEWNLPAIFEKEKIAFTQGHVVSLVITAIGMVLDFASWELNNTQLDVTGGDQNRALNAFREELLNQGFSQSVYDDFPTLLLKMYKLYYGITD